jgi:hypothetical protein
MDIKGLHLVFPFREIASMNGTGFFAYPRDARRWFATNCGVVVHVNFLGGPEASLCLFVELPQVVVFNGEWLSCNSTAIL